MRDDFADRQCPLCQRMKRDDADPEQLCSTCRRETIAKYGKPTDHPEHEDRIKAHKARVQADLDAVKRKRQEQGLDTEELKPSTAYYRAKKRKAEKVKELKTQAAKGTTP